MGEKKEKAGLLVVYSNRGILGREGEILVREWLVDQGYKVLPTSLINTGYAPKLESRTEPVILPDNLIWSEDGSHSCWLEVKTKTTATRRLYPPCAGRWEHGLPLRHWNSYCRIQAETRTPVFLAIVQVDRRLIFLGRIGFLKKGLHPVGDEKSRFINGEPHVFFGLNDFDKWFSIPKEYKIPNPIQPLALRTLKQSYEPFFKQLTLDEFLDYMLARSTLEF